jgi:hypothetical protein
MEFLPAPTQRAIMDPILSYICGRALTTRAPIKYEGHLEPNEIRWKECVRMLFVLQNLRRVNKYLYNAITNWFVNEWGSASIAAAFASKDHAYDYFKEILDNKLGSFRIVRWSKLLDVRVMRDSVIVKYAHWCDHMRKVFTIAAKYYEREAEFVNDDPCELCSSAIKKYSERALYAAVPRLRNYIKI